MRLSPTARRITQTASAALFGALLAVPVHAGQAEIDLLTSYTGDWKGSGALTGGDEPEDFTCRLQVAKGNAAKINFAGRCEVAGLNLSVAGTIAYNDDERRYEGAMTSNTAYSGLAIGRQRGSNIVFDFEKRETNDEGTEVAIDSEIILNKSAITVNFDVTFNNSGETLSTSVPFERS